MNTLNFSLEPFDALRFANVCGNLNENLNLITKRLQIEIFNRGNNFELVGDYPAIAIGKHLICTLYEQSKNNNIDLEAVHLSLQSANLQQITANLDNLDNSFNHQSTNLNTNSVNNLNSKNTAKNLASNFTPIKTPKLSIKARGINQQNYVKRIQTCAVNFGIGPAGTGKTYLAVACAVAALESEQIKRILLVRPAVEAGEKLGFLPGDLAQKIDPYLRPLYDALYEMLGFDAVTRLIEKQIIEVAPLAYMRGRTLNHSFIILDESQNTTCTQMKMFLTRLGFGSTAVITGDITQVDLPKNMPSGLAHASKILRDVSGISFTHFNSSDVVRHELVVKIIEAFDAHSDN